MEEFEMDSLESDISLVYLHFRIDMMCVNSFESESRIQF